MYALNINTLKYIKQILSELNGGIDSNTLTVDFSILRSVMDKTSKQMISKKTVDLNNSIDQMNQINIMRKGNLMCSIFQLYSVTKEWTLDLEHFLCKR